MTMRELFHRRPWLWIVLLLGVMVAANIVLMLISLSHQPISVKVD